MQEIRNAAYTTNVVELMVKTFQGHRGLSAQAQHLLGVAATIGFQFELGLIASVCGVLAEEVILSLAQATR